MALLRCPAVLCGTLAGVILGLADAQGCACCTNPGHRHEAVELPATTCLALLPP